MYRVNNENNIWKQNCYPNDDPKYIDAKKYCELRIFLQNKRNISSTNTVSRLQTNYQCNTIPTYGRMKNRISQLKLKKINKSAVKHVEKSTDTESLSSKYDSNQFKSVAESKMVKYVERSTDTDSISSALIVDHCNKLKTISDQFHSDLGAYQLWRDHIQLTLPSLAQLLPNVIENKIRNSVQVVSCQSCNGSCRIYELEILCRTQRELFLQQYKIMQNYLQMIKDNGLLQVPGMAAANCLHPLVENVLLAIEKPRSIF